ncbi:MAG: GNAT family N-acetyltransferase [Nostoc sp.]
MIDSFSVCIDRSDSQQHLNSHCLLISKFKQFLEPFNFPFFTDKFIGALRHRIYEIAGAKSSLENLQVYFQSPSSFFVKVVVKSLEDIISISYTFTVTDILAFPVNSEALLTTKRLEINLLLPSDEPKIIDFLSDPDVWKMRGQRYSPIENIHFIYQNHSDPVPWYKYNFAIRTRRNNKPIGFIGFYQLSQLDSVMLSYGLSKTYWGLGIMSEALAVCIPWFVTSQTVRELVAFAEVNNHSSRRLLQKLGLQEYGLLENSKFSADPNNMSQFIVHKSSMP